MASENGKSSEGQGLLPDVLFFILANEMELYRKKYMLAKEWERCAAVSGSGPCKGQVAPCISFAASRDHNRLPFF